MDSFASLGLFCSADATIKRLQHEITEMLGSPDLADEPQPSRYRHGRWLHDGEVETHSWHVRNKLRAIQRRKLTNTQHALTQLSKVQGSLHSVLEAAGECNPGRG